MKARKSGFARWRWVALSFVASAMVGRSVGGCVGGPAPEEEIGETTAALSVALACGENTADEHQVTGHGSDSDTETQSISGTCASNTFYVNACNTGYWGDNIEAEVNETADARAIRSAQAAMKAEVSCPGCPSGQKGCQPTLNDSTCSVTSPSTAAATATATDVDGRCNISCSAYGGANAECHGHPGCSGCSDVTPAPGGGSKATPL